MSGTSIRQINPPALNEPPGYSHVVEVQAGKLVFIAGQIAVDAKGAIVGKGDFATQAEQVFGNVGHALAAAGCTTADLVKMTVFVTDMGHLAAYRAARAKFLAGVTPPAVTLVEVSRLAGPDYLIEVEAIAAK